VDLKNLRILFYFLSVVWLNACTTGAINGVVFIPSPLTVSITETDIYEWETNLVNLWELKYKEKDILKSIQGAEIIAFDVPYLLLDKIQVRSIVWPDSKEIHLAVIGPNDYPSPVEWARLLSRHELSHLILGYLDNIWNEEEAHRIFHKVDPSLF
jgi:hypothetical protein